MPERQPPTPDYTTELPRLPKYDSNSAQVPLDRKRSYSADRKYDNGIYGEIRVIDAAGHRHVSYITADTVERRFNQASERLHLLYPTIDAHAVFKEYDIAWEESMADIEGHFEREYGFDTTRYYELPETHMAAAIATAHIVSEQAEKYLAVAWAGDCKIEVFYNNGTIWSTETEDGLYAAENLGDITLVQRKALCQTIDELTQEEELDRLYLPDGSQIWPKDDVTWAQLYDKGARSARSFWEDKKDLANGIKNRNVSHMKPVLNKKLVPLKGAIAIVSISDGIDNNTIASKRHGIMQQTDYTAEQKCWLTMNMAVESEDCLQTIKRGPDDKTISVLNLACAG